MTQPLWQKSNIKIDARIMTFLAGDDVVLEVAPGVNVRYMRRAIMTVVPDAPGDTGFVDEDESMDGSGPAKGTKGGSPADANEDGSATT